MKTKLIYVVPASELVVVKTEVAFLTSGFAEEMNSVQGVWDDEEE